MYAYRDAFRSTQMHTQMHIYTCMYTCMHIYYRTQRFMYIYSQCTYTYMQMHTYPHIEFAGILEANVEPPALSSCLSSSLP